MAAAASSSSSCMLQVATGTVTGSERARGTSESSGDSESLSKFTWVRIGLGGHDLIYYGMIVTMPRPYYSLLVDRLSDIERPPAAAAAAKLVQNFDAPTVTIPTRTRIYL